MRPRRTNARIKAAPTRSRMRKHAKLQRVVQIQAYRAQRYVIRGRGAMRRRFRARGNGQRRAEVDAAVRRGARRRGVGGVFLVDGRGAEDVVHGGELEEEGRGVAEVGFVRVFPGRGHVDAVGDAFAGAVGGAVGEALGRERVGEGAFAAVGRLGGEERAGYEEDSWRAPGEDVLFERLEGEAVGVAGVEVVEAVEEGGGWYEEG